MHVFDVLSFIFSEQADSDATHDQKVGQSLYVFFCFTSPFKYWLIKVDIYKIMLFLNEHNKKKWRDME